MNEKDYEYDPQMVQIFFERYYQDRGMVKWQGYYLSDHTAALKKEDAELAKEYPPKPLQTTEKRASVLAGAFANHKTVSIQLNTLDLNGNFQPDLVGKLLGYEAETIYLDNEAFVSLDDMRHVAIVD